MSTFEFDISAEPDPFWENILDKIKTFRGRSLPPEAYSQMAGQLETCLALAVEELDERLSVEREIT